MRVVLCHVGIRNIGFNSFYKKFDLTFDNIDTYLVPNGICYLGASLRAACIYLLLTYATNATGVKAYAPKDGASQKMKTTASDNVKARVGSTFLYIKPLWGYFSIRAGSYPAALSRMVY